MQPEFFGQFLAGQALAVFQRSLEPDEQRLAQFQPQVRIADEFADAVVDQPSHQLLQLFGRQGGDIHLQNENTDGGWEMQTRRTTSEGLFFPIAE